MTTTQATTRLAEAAELYAALGWSVIPLHDVQASRCSCGRECGNSRGKHPRIGEWQKHATDDADQVQAWWRKWPNANIGVQLGSKSGFVGIDIDPPNGEAVLLAISNGDLPPTLTMRTGKGRRLLYAIHDGVLTEPRTVAFQDQDGLESIRLQGGATGAQCVMPPSLHYSGRHYEWTLGPDDITPAPMPSWLVAEMCRPEKPAPADSRPRDDSAPWTDFNKRESWQGWLTDWGFKPAGGYGDVRYYTRPGKQAGVSVSVGHCRSADDTPAMYVFSGSIRDLPAGKTYDLFGAYARIQHGGDFSRAASALLDLGYGQRRVAKGLEDRVAMLERRLKELEQKTGHG
jgi:hypothetical protein